MPSFSVKMDEFHYCVTSPDGTDGPIVPYGERAVLDDGQYIYTCLIEDGNDFGNEEGQNPKPEIFRVDELTMLDGTYVDDTSWSKELTDTALSVDHLNLVAMYLGETTPWPQEITKAVNNLSVVIKRYAHEHGIVLPTAQDDNTITIIPQ